MKNGSFLLLLLAALGAALTACVQGAAESRTWTSTGGVTLEASFDSVAGTLVILEKADGGKTRIRIGQLSPEDQTWIREHQRAEQAALRPPQAESASDKRKLEWTDVEVQPAFCHTMTEREQTAVSDEDFKWSWAETPHFFIHYEKGIFALKVARMAEFFYDYIAEDLQGPKDLRTNKSHIYVFDSEKSWKRFLTQSGGLEWAAAYVRGDVMFLQRVGDNKTSSNVLAHEMTHLILNRFFKHHPPHWLNEGLAEWYEFIGRALFKGVGKNPKSNFSGGVSKDHFPFDRLLTATGYPESEQVRAFYESSRFVVGFLRLEHEEDLFIKYVRSVVLDGRDALETLPYSFGYADMDAFNEALWKFAK